MGYPHGSPIKHADGTVEYRQSGKVLLAFRVVVREVTGFSVRKGLLRRGIGAVGLVVAAATLTACSVRPDPIATGMAAGPTETQLQAADAFGSWVDALDLTDEFDLDEGAVDDITSYTDWDDDFQAVKALADRYPVSGSTVPALLMDAAAARSEALASYRERDFEGGERSAKQAASLMRQTRKALASDVPRVEADCDCRLVKEGWFGHPEPLSVAGSEDVAEVVEWIDGDTVETSEGTVRLIGIDTPEIADQCSKADDAKRNAEAIAPPGTEVELVSPYSVDDKDQHGRLLRYLDVPRDRGGEDESDGTAVVDVGYSQILSGLAVARYDSQDGFQWHPREGAYRDASGAVGPDLIECLAPAAAASNELNGADEDDDHHPVLQIVAGVFAQQIDDAGDSAKVARQAWTDHDEWDRSLDSPSIGGGGGGSGGNYRYCRGWICVG